MLTSIDKHCIIQFMSSNKGSTFEKDYNDFLFIAGLPDDSADEIRLNAPKTIVAAIDLINDYDLNENNIKIILDYYSQAKASLEKNISSKEMFADYDRFKEKLFFARKSALFKIESTPNFYFAVMDILNALPRAYGCSDNFPSDKEFEFWAFVRSLPTFKTLNYEQKVIFSNRLTEFSLDFPENVRYSEAAVSFIEELLSMLSTNFERYPERKAIHLKADLLLEKLSRIYEERKNFVKAKEIINRVIVIAKDCPNHDGPCVETEKRQKDRAKLCGIGRKALERLENLEWNTGEARLEFEGEPLQRVFTNVNDVYTGKIRISNIPAGVAGVEVKLVDETKTSDLEDLEKYFEKNGVKFRRYIAEDGKTIKKTGFPDDRSSVTLAFDKNGTEKDFKFKVSGYCGDTFSIKASTNINGIEYTSFLKLQVWRKYELRLYAMKDTSKKNVDLVPKVDKAIEVFNKCYIELDPIIKTLLFRIRPA